MHEDMYMFVYPIITTNYKHLSFDQYNISLHKYSQGIYVMYIHMYFQSHVSQGIKVGCVTLIKVKINDI